MVAKENLKSKTGIKIKPLSIWNIDRQFRLQLKKNNGCARTNGYYFKSGIVNWKKWCSCKKNCGNNWTFDWIMFLRGQYLQQIKKDQKITLVQLVIFDNKSKKYKYHLMDEKERKHQVCQQFFCKIYQTTTSTILKNLKMASSQPISSSPTEKRGIWNRNNPWKGKVSVQDMINWIENQEKEFSHYTRRWDQKTKKYFTKITNMTELFEKYQVDMICEEKPAMKRTSFDKYFKIFFKKKYEIKKNHLDVCSTCTKIKILVKKVDKKPNLEEQLTLLKKLHLEEADRRYNIWKKDKDNVITSMEKNDVVFDEGKILNL
jgi:hypothetical protein